MQQDAAQIWNTDCSKSVQLISKYWGCDSYSDKKSYIFVNSTQNSVAS